MSNIKNVQQYTPALQISNWKRTQKKKYQIYVCMPPLGTKVYNQLENVHYETTEKNPFVLSGTVGEQWIIDPAKLFKTYKLPTGEPLNFDYLKTKGQPYKIDWFKIETIGFGTSNWALFVPKTQQLLVSTSWGDVLTANGNGVPHGIGDFLVCADGGDRPNLTDMWVVNGEVFPTTYDMRAFPGKAGNVGIGLPKPKSLLNLG